MPMQIKPCKHCAQTGHTAFTCSQKPRKPLKTNKALKGKRRIRAIGKVGRQWIATRKEWIQRNIPDAGVWDCYYCGTELHLNKLQLDHKLSRSRHPELRYDLDNLVPCCGVCNQKKGSKSADEYLYKLKVQNTKSIL